MFCKRQFSKVLVAASAIAIFNPVMASPLEIAGSTTVEKSIIKKVASKAKGAGMPVKMLGVGSGGGVKMLIEGRVTVAAVSDELVNAVASARKKGAKNIPDNLQMHEIMMVGVVPIVHPSNKVPSMSADQLKGILSGKITNWAELGGVDAPINVVVPAEGSGTRAYLEKKVLKGAKITDTAKVMRSSAAEINAVRRDEQAFAMAGVGVARSVGKAVQIVEAPKYTRPLALVTIGDPSPAVARLLTFLRSDEVQSLLASN